MSATLTILEYDHATPLGFCLTQECSPIFMISRAGDRSYRRKQFAWADQNTQASTQTPQCDRTQIGHLKSDHRMSRCFLPGLCVDAINAVLAAAGSNLRKLLRRPFLSPHFGCCSMISYDGADPRAEIHNRILSESPKLRGRQSAGPF